MTTEPARNPVSMTLPKGFKVESVHDSHLFAVCDSSDYVLIRRDEWDRRVAREAAAEITDAQIRDQDSLFGCVEEEKK